MDAAGSSSSPLRIVIVPWLAFGHMLPYLELAERLASRGHHVSYVSTPRNLARLPPLRPAAAPRVDLVALPLPRVDGLPEGAESTNDVPDDQRELHWKAFDGLAAPFAEFMAAACADEATRPHWVIADCFHHWVAAAAVQHKVIQICARGRRLVPLIPIYLKSCSMLHRSPGAMRDTSPDSCFDRYRAPRPAGGSTGCDPHPPWLRGGGDGTHVRRSRRVGHVPRPALQLDERKVCAGGHPELRRVGARVLPAGANGHRHPGRARRPAAAAPDGARRADGTNGSAEHATVRWLDAQPPGSVVYVALGSEVPLGVEQVHELALGLEVAGARFLWALRKPSGAAADDGVGGTDMLPPPGFQDRTSGHGLVTTGWVPQMSILAHGAVGGFLTHCGRNSLIEGLLFGHPLVMLPIFGDQGPNARQMEAKKVGLQVARNEDDGSFDRHGVSSAVRAVMVDEEARRGFVEGAAKMQAVVGDKELQERYIDEFVQHLRSYGASASAK